MTDDEKIARVDRWLSDVSKTSMRWRSAKQAQQSTECVIAYLEEIRARIGSASPDMEARMDDAIEKNRGNALLLAKAAEECSELESGFYSVMAKVEPPEVAEAWRMRFIEGKTWTQCARELHYNRQHLERLSKTAKPHVYGMIPGEYRRP